MYRLPNIEKRQFITNFNRLSSWGPQAFYIVEMANVQVAGLDWLPFATLFST